MLNGRGLGNQDGGLHMGASNVLIAGAVLLSVASLGGCATKKYVNEQVSAVDTKVVDVSARVADHDTKLGTLDQTTREALQRAEAACKLAEGNYGISHELEDDSM